MSAMTIERTGANDAVIEWIQAILDNKGWTGTDLANRAELAPSTVLRLLNDKNHRFVPSFKTLQKISDAANYPIPQVVLQSVGLSRAEPTNTFDPGAVQAKRAERVATSSAAPAVVQKPEKRLRVQHVSSLPQQLHPTLRDTVTVPCPPQLETDASAFAFYMPDNSLEPFVRAGTLMYATKRRDPIVGDMLLLTDMNGRSKVRVLKDISAEGFTLEAPGPFGDEIPLAFDQVQEVSVVAGIWKL